MDTKIFDFLEWEEFETLITGEKVPEFFKKNGIIMPEGYIQLNLEILFPDYTTKPGYLIMRDYSMVAPPFIELNWFGNKNTSYNLSQKTVPKELRFRVHPQTIILAKIKETGWS